MIRFARIGYRIILPNSTNKTLYMTSDGLGTAVSQAFTTDAGGTTTSVEKAGGAAFAATAAGCMVRCVTATQAANVGLSRKVVTRDGNDDLTVNPFPANVTIGDTMVLERELKTVRRVKLVVEAGGHLHYPERADEGEGAALVGDPLIDESEVRELLFPKGITALPILTDSDVSAVYVNVMAE